MLVAGFVAGRVDSVVNDHLIVAGKEGEADRIRDDYTKARSI